MLFFPHFSKILPWSQKRIRLLRSTKCRYADLLDNPKSSVLFSFRIINSLGSYLITHAENLELSRQRVCRGGGGDMVIPMSPS